MYDATNSYYATCADDTVMYGVYSNDKECDEGEASDYAVYDDLKDDSCSDQNFTWNVICPGDASGASITSDEHLLLIVLVFLGFVIL